MKGIIKKFKFKDNGIVLKGTIPIEKELIYPLLLVLILLTSCSRQIKTQPSTNNLGAAPIGLPKISKPTGMHQDDNLYCGLQDKSGNLWFGTSSGEGVYRYDGKSFINFTEKDGLSSNDVYSILEDKAGNVWFGTKPGLCRYDGKTFTSITITATNGNNFSPSVSSENNPSAKIDVWSIFQDKSGKLWFGTSEGVYCYDGKVFTRFLDDKSIVNKDNVSLKHINCIMEDKNGNFWFASGPLGQEGAIRYDGKTLTNFKPYGDTWVRRIIEDKNGNLLFVTRHKGVCRFDSVPGGFTNISDIGGLGSWSVTSILEDKAGNLWFGEDKGNNSGVYKGGLWRYDGKTFTHFTTQDGLSNNGVWCIIQDNDENIWIGSRCNGLSRYDGKAFTNFTE